MLGREKPYGQGAPDTAYPVNRNGAYGIVNTDLVEGQNGDDHQNPGKRPDKYGGIGRNGIGTGRNTHETGKNPVQGHGRIKLMHEKVRGSHGGKGTGRSSKGGIDEYERYGSRVCTQHRSPVKPEPAEPEQENPHRCKRDVVTR